MVYMGPKKVIQPNKMIYISFESIFWGDARLATVQFPNLLNLVWTWFWTWVQESGSAEYLNLNPLADSGSSRGWTQTWGSNLEPQPQNVILWDYYNYEEIDNPHVAVPRSQIAMTTVAVPISLITLTMTMITTWPPLTLTTIRRTWNSRTAGPE